MHEYAAQANQWIPVSERLPENNKPVFIYHVNSGTVEAILSEGNNWVGKGNAVPFCWGYVSHWMPKPEPPKQ